MYRDKSELVFLFCLIRFAALIGLCDNDPVDAVDVVDNVGLGDGTDFMESDITVGGFLPLIDSGGKS